jgi:hypothetical protein
MRTWLRVPALEGEEEAELAHGLGALYLST